MQAKFTITKEVIELEAESHKLAYIWWTIVKSIATQRWIIRLLKIT